MQGAAFDIKATILQNLASAGTGAGASASPVASARVPATPPGTNSPQLLNQSPVDPETRHTPEDRAKGGGKGNRGSKGNGGNRTDGTQV